VKQYTYKQKQNIETAWKQIWKFFDLFKCDSLLSLISQSVNPFITLHLETYFLKDDIIEI